MTKRILISILLFTIIAPIFLGEAFAFKSETHIWVAQQVLNDLEDGVLSFDLDGQPPVDISVAPAVRDAVLSNRNVFRMGSIGPDAFPDIFTGQFLVHPGTAHSWSTDDWLDFLLKSQDTYLMDPSDISDCHSPEACSEPIGRGASMNGEQSAFVLGYLSHAAADVFSHTYVNQYSGDIFVLSDGIAEEERHIELEKYIAKATPPLIDINGSALGTPHQVIRVPADFIKNRLIFNDEVAARNQTGGAIHLYLVHELRKTLLEDFGTWHEDLFNWAIRAAVCHVTQQTFGTCIDITDEEADALADFLNAMNTFVQDSLPIDEAQRAKDDLVDAIERVTNLTNEMHRQFEDAIFDKDGLLDQLEDLERQVVDKLEELNDVQKEICEWVNKPICWPLPWPLNEWCEDRVEEVCEINPVWETLKFQYDTLVKARNAARDELERHIRAKQEITQTVTDIFLDTLHIGNDALNGITDLIQILSQDLNLIAALRDNWVRDIESGMREWVVANAQALKNDMTGDNMLDPLKAWYDCYFLSIAAGLPSPINTAACQIEDRIQSIMDAVDRLDDLMLELTPGTQPIVDFKAHIREQVEGIIEDLISEMSEAVIGMDVMDLVDLFNAPASAERLNLVFGGPRYLSEQKGLIYINDMAARINADMNLTNAYFDPLAFNVARNAVTLAKMALLSSNGLNQLAGKHLYGNQICISWPVSICFAVGGKNVLVGAVGSIDGSFQWMRKAPPSPRREGFIDELWFEEDGRVYGYGPTDPNKGGFKFWVDCETRENVFRRLFRGPLMPALEIPETLGFSPLLPDSYAYVGSIANPFPDDEWGVCTRPDNLPPIADAGTDVAIYVGELAAVDGSGSSDPDNLPREQIVYSWELVSVPDGSMLTNRDLHGATDAQCSLVPDVQGAFELELTVTDGQDMVSDQVRVISMPPRNAADLNGDGSVNMEDFNLIRSHFNQPASECPVCDIDGDGTITVLDGRKLIIQCDCPQCASICN